MASWAWASPWPLRFWFFWFIWLFSYVFWLFLVASLGFIGFFGFLMCFLVLWPCAAQPRPASRAQPAQHSGSQLSPAWQRQLGRIQSSQDSEEIIDTPKQQFSIGSLTVKKSSIALRNSPISHTVVNHRLPLGNSMIS